MTNSSLDDHNIYFDNRLKKLEAWRKAGIEPFAYRYKVTHETKKLLTTYAALENGQHTSDYVSVAGRIMALRNDGMFIDLQDHTGRIQVFTHSKDCAEDYIQHLDKLDIGDIIGVTGYIRRTPRGELTINTKEFTILTKNFFPLPEKYHGLTDIETRYRQRYADLIMNKESQDRLRARSHIIAEIRSFLLQKNFLEVETPMLQSIAGGAAALPFVTHHNSLGIDLFLRIAPELYLKRLLVGGLSDKIFEINRNFRNEGISMKHNPEFTMMEVYQAYADYDDMLSMTEELVTTIAQKIFNSLTFQYKNHTLSFERPWRKISMIDSIKEITHIDFMQLKDPKEAAKAAKSLDIHIEEGANWGKIIEAVFSEKVEPTLIQPTHITHFPKEISPLARQDRVNPELTERFETFVNGWEIANAFSELNDPIEQRKRFEQQLAEIDKGDKEAHKLDEDFLHALEYGMPPAGGLGIGIDRLVMILTNADNIRDVIAFPTMRPKN